MVFLYVIYVVLHRQPVLAVANSPAAWLPLTPLHAGVCAKCCVCVNMEISSMRHPHTRLTAHARRDTVSTI